MQWRAAEEIGLVGIGGLWAYMEGDKGRIGMNWEQLKEVWVRNVWQFWCKPACIGLEGLVLKAQIDSIGLSEPSIIKPLGPTRTGAERMLDDAGMPRKAERFRICPGSREKYAIAATLCVFIRCYPWMIGHSNPLDTRLFKVIRNLFTVSLVVHFNSITRILPEIVWTFDACHEHPWNKQYDLFDRDLCVSRVRPHLRSHTSQEAMM